MRNTLQLDTALHESIALTPLAVIASLLNRVAEPELVAEVLQTQVRQPNRLLDDLLSFSNA